MRAKSTFCAALLFLSLFQGWGMDPEALGFIEWMDAMMAVSVSKAPSPYLPMWQRIDTFLERLLRAHVPE